MSKDRPSRTCITVGIPTYNSERFIGETLASVMAQQHADLRILIRDDGSDDATPALCREAAARDPRIEILDGGQRLGWIGNFNALLEHAQGDYFCWAPHDDVMEPAYLATLLSRLQARPEAVLAYSAALRIDEAGAVLGPWAGSAARTTSSVPLKRAMRFLWATEWDKGIPIHGLMRTWALRRAGGLRPVHFAADNVLLFHLSLLGPFVYDARPLHRKRTVRHSVSMHYGHRLWEWTEYLAAHRDVVRDAELSRLDGALLTAATWLRQTRMVATRPLGRVRRRWRASS